MNINNKNIIITGASSGIGLSLLSMLLSYENVRIVAVARNIETIPSASGVVFPFSTDISNKEGVDRMFGYAHSVFGEVDIFIANAGYAYLERMSEPDWNRIESIYNLNVFSPIYSLRKLVEEKSDKPKSFVCTISAVAQVPLPYYSLYCSTKSALHQFVETYRHETPANLNVVAVYPVATRTAFFEKATTDSQPLLPFPSQNVEVVAKAILKGIAKDKKRVYPSSLFRIFNFLGQLFPFVFSVYAVLEKRKVDKKLHI